MIIPRVAAKRKRIGGFIDRRPATTLWSKTLPSQPGGFFVLLFVLFFILFCPNQVASSYLSLLCLFYFCTFFCAFFLRTLAFLFFCTFCCFCIKLSCNNHAIASITQLYWLCFKIKRAVPRYAKFPYAWWVHCNFFIACPTKLDRCKHLNYLCWIWIRVQTNQSFDQIKVIKSNICICAVVVATKMKRF